MCITPAPDASLTTRNLFLFNFCGTFLTCFPGCAQEHWIACPDAQPPDCVITEQACLLFTRIYMQSMVSRLHSMFPSLALFWPLTKICSCRVAQDVKNAKARIESSEWKFDPDDARSVDCWARANMGPGGECIFYQPQDVTKNQARVPHPSIPKQST